MLQFHDPSVLCQPAPDRQCVNPFIAVEEVETYIHHMPGSSVGQGNDCQDQYLG